MFEPVFFFFSPLMPKNDNFTAIFDEGRGILLSPKLQPRRANYAQVTIIQDADVNKNTITGFFFPGREKEKPK